MALEDFEELKIDEFCNIVSLGWNAPVLTADFGGGYGAGAITASYGLHRWSLSSSLLPDLDDYSVDYNADGDDFTNPRFTYFFEFIKRHLLRGNKPFIIRDTRTGKKFMAAFADAAAGASFEQITAKIFTGGIALIERRVSGVTFNADGSIDLDYTAPVISSLTISGSAPYEGTRTLTCSVTDNTAVTRVDFYIDHEFHSSDSATAFTASWNTRLHKNGVRTVTAKAYDAAGNVAIETLDVTLENDFVAPVVVFTSPAPNAEVSGLIDFVVSFIETGSGIDRVEYYQHDGDDFNYLGDGVSGSAHSFNYDTEEQPNGSVEFAAIAFDNAGNQSAAAFLTLDIQNVFDPADIPNLVFYTEADRAGLSDGTTVGTISDYSGNGYNLSSSGSARPTYQTNELNGLPVFEFDGSNDYSYNAGGGATASQITLAFCFIDLYFGSPGSTSSIFSMSSGGELFYYQGTNLYAFGIGGIGYSANFAMPSAKGIVIVKINCAANNIKIIVNGTEVFNGSLSGSLPGSLTLNTLIAGSLGAYAFGAQKIAGMLGTNNLISDADKDALIEMWNEKYNIY